LQQIIGFFEECEGEATSFYFEPPTLSLVAAQAIGTGDGSTARRERTDSKALVCGHAWPKGRAPGGPEPAFR
jgi:hypothetical protein